MAIIEKLNFDSSYSLNQTLEQQENLETKTNSPTLGYLDYLYNYPPKVRLKWDLLDDLDAKEKQKFKTTNFKLDLDLDDLEDDITLKSSTISQYVKGGLEKVNSSKFFNQKAKPIQTALANIPIYVILNGQNEIVLTKPSNIINPRAITDYINQAFYDYCGAFDSNVEKRQQYGLFFMNRLDAETYLAEIANSDVEGTQTVGLSIHCIGLDAAYKVTREYHPGIDFRFIPKFDEVKNLLEKNLTKSDIIVEDEQHQTRFRKRNINLFPYFGKISNLLSPGFSFLQKNEYFKGVPIYIVECSPTSKSYNSLLGNAYFGLSGKLDGITGRSIQFIKYLTGFGQDWVMQGSFQDAASPSDEATNYIFFEKEQATDFIKLNKKFVTRYKGSRTKDLASIVRKPNIFVYNLEDFLEDWEDQLYASLNNDDSILKTGLNSKDNYFIPTADISNEIKSFSKANYFKKFGQTLNIKFRTLTSFIGVFFSVN